MSKYCPIMSHHNKWQEDVECYGKECAWADKNGTCLVKKALRQITDPLFALAQGCPTDQNISHSQPTYKTDWVWKDTTTSPAIDLPYSPNTNTPIDYPYRPLKLTLKGEESNGD